jgi:hypothetical protein
VARWGLRVSIASWWHQRTVQRHERSRQAGIEYGRLIGPSHPARSADLGQLALAMHLFKQDAQPRSAREQEEWNAYMSGVMHVVSGPTQHNPIEGNHIIKDDF